MAFHPIDRDTDFLLPPSVQEWLPEAHLARYVVEGGQVLGMISIGDLVKAVIEDQQQEIAQLQQYIAS